MNSKQLFTKTLAGLLALVMLFGVLVHVGGAGVSAEGAAAVKAAEGAVTLDKTAHLTADGTYSIDLEAHTADENVTTIVTHSTEPIDYVLLIDQSGSMRDVENIPQAPDPALIWHGQRGFGPMSIETRHLTAIKTAVNEFIDLVHSKATAEVNHRIAVVGFAGGYNTQSQDHNYTNTEVFVGAAQYGYNGYDGDLMPGQTNIGQDWAQNHYGDVFQDVTVPAQLANLKASKDAFDAQGGTALHLGMEMVEGVIRARNEDPDYYGRKTVVIVFTDGVTGSLGQNRRWANEAVATANNVKNALNSEIYCVSLISHVRNFEYEKRYKGWLGNRKLPAWIEEDWPTFYDNNQSWFNNAADQILWTDSYRLVAAISSNYPNAQYGVMNKFNQNSNGYLTYLGAKNPNLPNAINGSNQGMIDLRAYDGYCFELHDAADVQGRSPVRNVQGLMTAYLAIENITDTVIEETVGGGGESISLTGDAIMRDMLSEYFFMPEAFSVDNVIVRTQVPTGGSLESGFTFAGAQDETYARSGNADANGWYSFVKNGSGVDGIKVRINKGEGLVEVKGFNYKEQYCRRNADNSYGGRKLLVTITGIEANDWAVGDQLPTNLEAHSGVTPGEGQLPPEDMRFPLPTVNIREKYFVYDFCRDFYEENPDHFFGKNGHDVKAVLALDAPYKQQNVNAYSEEYSTSDEDGVLFTAAAQDHQAADNGVVFSIKQISHSDFVVGALLQLDDDTYEWCKLTFLPATNVHYEENNLRYNKASTRDDANAPKFVELEQSEWRLAGAGKETARQGIDNIVYGYEAEYNVETHGDSNAATAHIVVDQAYLDAVMSKTAQWPVAHFRFTGTGFDILSRSGADTGVLAVDVVPHGLPRNYADGTAGANYAHLIVDTYYGDAENQYEKTLHQIPVLRVTGLLFDPQGYDVYISPVYHKVFDHTPKTKDGKSAYDPAAIEGVKIPGLPEVDYQLVNASDYSAESSVSSTRNDAPVYGTFNVYLDSIRVYEPRTGEGITAIDRRAYEEAGELAPQYRQIRDILLDPEQYVPMTDNEGNTVYDSEGKPVYAINGIIYIDAFDGYDPTRPVKVENYETFGPNNETYLMPTHIHGDGDIPETQQAFAFTLKEWNNTTSRLHISAKAPYGKVHLHVNGRHVAVVQSSTEMYYDVTDVIRETNGVIYGTGNPSPNGHVIISAYIDASEAGAVDDHRVLSLVNVKFIENAENIVHTTRDIEFRDDAGSLIKRIEDFTVGNRLQESDFPTEAQLARPGKVYSHDYNGGIIPSSHNNTPYIVTYYYEDEQPVQQTCTVQFVPKEGAAPVAAVVVNRGTILHNGITLPNGSTFTWPTVPAPDHGWEIGSSAAGGWLYTFGEITEDTTIYAAYTKINMATIYFSFGNLDAQFKNGGQLLLSTDTTFNTIPQAPNNGNFSYSSAHYVSNTTTLVSSIPSNAVNDLSATVTDTSKVYRIEVEPGDYRVGIYFKNIRNGTNWWFNPSGGADNIRLAPGQVKYYRVEGKAVTVYNSYNGPSTDQHNIMPMRGDAAAPATSGTVRTQALRGAGSFNDGELTYITSNADTLLFAEAVLAGVDGDANHDRVADLMDALLIMRCSLGQDTGLDIYGRYCADYNRDGEIDVTDALFVMRASLAN